MSTVISESRVGKPAEAGVDPKSLIRLIDGFEAEGIAIHTIQIRRHDIVIVEAAYEPYRVQDRHMLFSLSKSFTATAIGFAVQEGLLTVQDRLIDFFPDVLPTQPCPNMERVTIRHLLSMNTGHETEPEIFRPDRDWTEAFLGSYIPHEPGSRFLYNTAATYMLSAILTKVTGESCFEYLKKHLFEPLGFESEPWWEEAPNGISTGGFGLNLSVQDIGRFARFCLHEGQWNGKRLLAAEWFREASTAWSDNSIGHSDADSDWAQGYGYQFWICQPEGIYRGDGACGQFAIICPEQDMTISITSGTGKLQEILKLIWRELLPGLSDVALADDKNILADQVALEERLNFLSLWTPKLPYPEADLKDVLADLSDGKDYELSSNSRGIKALGITEDYLGLTIENVDEPLKLSLDAVCWTAGNIPYSLATKSEEEKKHGSFDFTLPEQFSYRILPLSSEEGRRYLLMDLAFTETVVQERWLIELNPAYLRIAMQSVSSFRSADEKVLGIAT